MVQMCRQFPRWIVYTLVGIVLLANGTRGAPDPRNFLFENADMEATTEAAVTEPVTSAEYLLMDNEKPDLMEEDNLVAQASEPTETIIASASSTSGSSSTSNGKPSSSNTQANLLLLQQLQEQLRRQQLLQNKLQQPIQNSIQTQHQQPQFSLDALVKSFVKVFQVAKTKIDQGARTVTQILQFFDKKKYTNITPAASETNLVLT